MKTSSRKILVIGLLFLFLGASATLCVSAIGPWSDNFDTYTNGQLLDGTSDDGGWRGWANNPLAFGTVTTAKYRSAPHGLDIKAASDLVHFYNDTEGKWVYTAWIFIPTGQSGGTYGGTYFIMQDVYTSGGSDTHWAVQLQFDNINNVVESEFDAGFTPPLIYNQWKQIRIVADFDTDWLEIYYDNQLLIEKPWTSGVNNGGDGVRCLATVDLFADSSTTVYYDDLSWLPYSEELECSAGGPYTGEVGEAVSFGGTATGGTSPYTWAWTFGDGGTGTGQTPTHTYTAPGVYNVTLTVTDSLSATASDETTATITESTVPVIEIGTITGGLFKVKAIIKNTGDAAATDVDWKIQLTGGLIILGKESTGTIPTLNASGEVTVSSKLIVGFGKTVVKVTADTATKSQNATVLLVFIKTA